MQFKLCLELVSVQLKMCFEQAHCSVKVVFEISLQYS